MARTRAASVTASEQAASPLRKRHRYQANRAAKSRRNAERSENRARTALVLGGGAPNMALMAGAVAAFVDRKRRFRRGFGVGRRQPRRPALARAPKG